MIIQFNVQCIGCEKVFPFSCRKPSLLTPTRRNVRCPNCESSMIFRVDRHPEPEKRSQVAVTALKFNPSAMFLEALAMAEEEAKEVKENETDSSNNTTASEPSQSEGQNERTV
jgi:DNA-directed RNA polymerase subunit RPC12/RpoP